MDIGPNLPIWESRWKASLLFLGLFATRIAIATSAQTSVPDTTVVGAVEDGQIQRLSCFRQQPVPLDRDPSPQDNRKVFDMLHRLTAANPDSAIVELEKCVKASPDSRWTPAIRLHLAERLYQRGFFERAESIWEHLWSEYRAAKDGPEFSLAESALIHLLKLSSAWGRRQRLESLLGEVGERKLSGAGFSAKEHAREVLWYLSSKVVQNAQCGPIALYAIKDSLAQHYEPVDLDILSEKTIQTGLSADDLLALAKRLAMDLRWAKRPAGNSPIPVPCVVHWRSGHYSAIIHAQGGEYVLEDRPAHFQAFVPLEAIAVQTSGYFLIPGKGELPLGWKLATENELAGVFGRHCSHSRTDGGKGVAGGNPTVGGNGAGDDGGTAGAPGGDPGCGMPVYTFHNLSASLLIRDTPLSYQPPVGPKVQLTLSYKQYDEVAPSSRNYANFGSQWSFNYVGFLTGLGLQSQIQGAMLNCVLPNGGYEQFQYDTATKRFKSVDFLSHTFVVKSGDNAFTRVFPDGTRQIYARPDKPISPTVILLTGIEDDAGNRLNLEYAANNFRLTKIVDAIGQVTTFSYAYSDSANFYRITGATDPFGGSCSFKYDVSGRLVEMTDVMGMTSRLAG